MKLTTQQVNSETQLTPGMLANVGSAFKIVSVEPAGKKYQFSDVYILVAGAGKRKYEVPVKFINEDFQELATKLGMDTDKWTGKSLTFTVGEYTSGRTQKVSDILRFELSTAK